MCIAGDAVVLLPYCWLLQSKALLVLLFGDGWFAPVWTAKSAHFFHQYFLSRVLCWSVVFGRARPRSLLSNTVLFCFGGFV
jgi:hypothetical protein